MLYALLWGNAADTDTNFVLQKAGLNLHHSPLIIHFLGSAFFNHVLPLLCYKKGLHNLFIIRKPQFPLENYIKL